MREKRCLEGTRRALLTGIIDRLDGVYDCETPNRIVLLTGMAGSGKSAVAHQIAHHFKSLPQRLGSSFCFSASNQAERSVDRFFSTISRNLAELDDEWKDALVDVIKSDREKRTTRSPREQLEEFIIKPAQKLCFIGPIIIVVDALDEVAYDERKALADCLSQLAADNTLPDNLRFFITSRPDLTLDGALEGQARVHKIDILSADAKDDIYRFIEHEQMTSGTTQKIIQETWVSYLAEQAEDSFQWAYTSCQFIKTDIPGLTAEDRFTMLKRLEYCGLEPLYEAIMRQITTVGNALKTQAFEDELRGKVQRVLSLIISVEEPLPWSAWVDLLGEDHEDMKTAESVLPHFGSLFRGVSAADRAINQPIQPAHTSLRDYLTHVIPGNLFLVDTSVAHVKLVNACLRTMDTQLRFNICGLKTSYRANKDVPCLAQRIQNNISPALTYACRFWSFHLTSSTLR